MAEYLIKGETLTTLADAIRDKTGKTGRLSLSAMAESINSIEGNNINFSIMRGRVEPSDPGDTLTYDGSMEGRESAACTAMGESTYAFKVSDVTPTIEDFANGYVVTFGGGTDGGITSDAFPAHTSGGKVIFADGYGFVAPNEFTDTEGKTCPKGTYFANFGSTTQYTTDYIAILQIPGYTGFATKPAEEETYEENTILIDTDEEITSWIFSVTEPESPSEGMVWIFTGSASIVDFNALRDNGIQVYPLTAKQYVGGEWVDVEAQIYQGGEWKVWIDWSKWIVKAGLYKLPMVAEGVPYDPSYPETTFTVTQKDGYVLFEQTTGTGMVLWGPVELSGVNTITIEGDFSDGVNGSHPTHFMLGVWGQFPPGQINTWDARVLLTATGATLDVSTISGERYVGFSVRNAGSERVSNLYIE